MASLKRLFDRIANVWPKMVEDVQFNAALKPGRRLVQDKKPGDLSMPKENAPQIRLVRPSYELAASYAAMRDAFMAAGEDDWTGKQAIAHRNVDEYITMVLNWSQGEDLPKNWGPADEYWILKDDVVVGDCGIRHPLTPQLEQWGGHIGYAVHPAYRNQGIATFAMREGLRLLADKGVAEALVTCAHDNVASIHVIEKFGGMRIEDSRRRRYLVPTGFISNAALI